MFCKNCGKEVENDVKYCSNCGFNLQETKDDFYDDTTMQKQNNGQSVIKKKKRPSILGIVGFALSIDTLVSIIYVSTCLSYLYRTDEVVYGVMAVFFTVPFTFIMLLVSGASLALSIIGLSRSKSNGLILKGLPISGIIISSFAMVLSILSMTTLGIR